MLHADGLLVAGNLVADAPHEDARVIAVALHDGSLIASRPLLEVEVVVVVALSFEPCIKRFVDNKHSQTVAGVEECSRRTVVSRAYGIEPVVLERLNTSCLRLFESCSTKHAVVVVYARTMNIRLFSV